jgi:transposase
MILLAKSALLDLELLYQKNSSRAREVAMLQIHEWREIPDESKRGAQDAFPNGNLAMRMRDELGAVYADEQFQDLFSERGQPAESPSLLAFVIVLQFAEGLTDRQAADAVRGRIDWQYALGLGSLIRALTFPS